MIANNTVSITYEKRSLILRNSLSLMKVKVVCDDREPFDLQASRIMHWQHNLTIILHEQLTMQ